VPRTANSPTVSVAQLGDRVISSLGQAVPSKIADLSPQTNAQVFELTVGGIPYFLLRKTLGQFGDPPFIIGIYGPAEMANAPLQPLYVSAVIGLVILLGALISAALLSHAIAKPIRRVTESVTKVGRFSPSAIEPVPEAWIREVGDLARSFNGMLNGLRYFETYVPQKLVQRLIKQEGGAEVVSEERELTVMFTDIADFTGLCEDMTAQEVADFLNTHFTLLGQCVEDEGGTIDKYIGDSLMAFWGAPEQLENSVEKACRAARAIAVAMAKENQRRVAQGRAPVRIRLGIHTGPLVVGNIGSPSRINYTVVGDTVNAAQRLESLGKELGPNDAAIILISDATMRKLPDEFQTRPAGSFPVKGKSETITVHQLMA
jgi:adenylate cyclase